MCGYPAPSREKRQVTPTLTKEGTGVSRTGHNEDGWYVETPIKQWPAEISSTLNASFGSKLGLENQHINADCPMFVPTKAFYESSLAQYKESDVGGTLKASGGVGGGGSETFLAQPIALAENTIGRKPENGGNHDGFTENGPMYTLNATGVHGVAQPISFDMAQITSKVNGTKVEQGLPVSTLAKGSQMHVAQAIPIDTMNHIGRGDKHSMGDFVPGAPSYTLTKGHSHAVAFPWQSALDPIGNPVDLSGTLVKNQTMACMTAMQVRRLTPVECERLQGFPDNYTDIKSKGKPTPDGPRYKALGNSMAVPVMAWIGKRIQEVEAINAP
jgi:hypothetical protein